MAEGATARAGGYPIQVVRYEAMRVAVEQCARIDEAADIRDKAAALAAYARQRDDAELAVWTQEIKLRASVRIGELVRELDTQERARTDLHDSTVGQTKTEAVEAAGLTPRTAQRYQELAGPREEQAHKAAHTAAELHYAQARADKRPATMEGLRAAVKQAVQAVVGKPEALPLPTPAEARELSRKTGEGIPASDGNIHTYVDPDDRQKQLDWYSFQEPIEALAKLEITSARAVEVMTPSQAKRIRKPLAVAIAWLAAFEELHNA